MVAAQEQKGQIILQDSTKREKVLHTLRKEPDSSVGKILYKILPLLRLGNFEGKFVQCQLKFHLENLVNVLDETTKAGRFETPKLVIALLSNEDLEISTALKEATDFVNVVIVGVGVVDKK